jgi:MacB-like periplasmic core domain
MAATPEIQSILGYTIASGSFFTEQEEASRANVVVIGATIARTVFAGMDPVGQPVQLNGIPFTIKGVFAAQGSNGELDLDNIGVVPYSVLDRLRGNGVMFAIGQTNLPQATGCCSRSTTCGTSKRSRAATSSSFSSRIRRSPASCRG